MLTAKDFMPVGGVVGVDFETFYSSEYSVSDLGDWAYVHHPLFNAWAVSVSDGVTACACAPKDFPWARIDGLTWVSHNRGFDQAVYERLFELWGIPSVLRPEPSAWFCTAAACAFLQYPRDLAGAALAVLGLTVDKTVRKSGKGVRGADPLQGLLFELELCADEAEYAATDAIVCKQLWDAVGPQWPAHERRLYDVTAEMGYAGLLLDWEKVGQKAVELTALAERLKASLPWTPALSSGKFEAACIALGVKPPKCLDVGDPDFQFWAEDNKESVPGHWAATMGKIRRVSRLAKILGRMVGRRLPNGRLCYELRYFGATPGRWSGTGRLNMQNLNRREAEGIELRKCIVAPPGFVLCSADYSQIEARVLLFLAGDFEALADLAAHPEWDLYELHARKTMGYDRDEPLEEFCAREGSNLRQLAKARVLGLGFRCGAETFIRVARVMAKLVIGRDEARTIVADYRRSNPRIVHLWNDLEADARQAAGNGEGENDYRLAFPCTRADPRCGRYLFYRDVRRHAEGRGLLCTVAGERVPLHGGIIAENWTQGTARDVLASAWLRCRAAGYFPVLSVHDELLFELREETAREDMRKIREIMERPVPWAPGLPLMAPGKLMSRYGK